MEHSYENVYKITLYETLSKTYYVQSETAAAANKWIQDKYEDGNEDFVLGADDHDETEVYTAGVFTDTSKLPAGVKIWDIRKG